MANLLLIRDCSDGNAVDTPCETPQQNWSQHTSRVAKKASDLVRIVCFYICTQLAKSFSQYFHIMQMQRAFKSIFRAQFLQRSLHFIFQNEIHIQTYFLLRLILGSFHCIFYATIRSDCCFLYLRSHSHFRFCAAAMKFRSRSDTYEPLSFLEQYIRITISYIQNRGAVQNMENAIEGYAIMYMKLIVTDERRLGWQQFAINQDDEQSFIHSLNTQTRSDPFSCVMWYLGKEPDGSFVDVPTALGRMLRYLCDGNQADITTYTNNDEDPSQALVHVRWIKNHLMEFASCIDRHLETECKPLQEVQVAKGVACKKSMTQLSKEVKHLDSIDPNLYCFIPNVTPQLDITPRLTDNIMENMINSIFARNSIQSSDVTQTKLLPSEFRVNADGGVTIRSYINNVHPVQHRGLYSAIATIFQAAVPAFDHVLSCLASEAPCRVVPSSGLSLFDPRNVFYHPTMPTYLPDHEPSTNYTLKGTTVQVGVRLQKFRVPSTGNVPVYHPRTHYRFSGFAHENIVATGYYFFDMQNVARVTMDARRMVHDSDPTYRAFQNMGGLTVSDNQLAVIPNTLQHRFGSIELKNTTKRGRMKILTFYIIDPLKPILSTAMVAPQQEEWRCPIMGRIVTKLPIPVETACLICAYLGTGMSPQLAAKYKTERKREFEKEEDEDTEVWSIGV